MARSFRWSRGTSSPAGADFQLFTHMDTLAPGETLTRGWGTQQYLGGDTASEESNAGVPVVSGVWVDVSGSTTASYNPWYNAQTGAPRWLWWDLILARFTTLDTTLPTTSALLTSTDASSHIQWEGQERNNDTGSRYVWWAGTADPTTYPSTSSIYWTMAWTLLIQEAA